MGNLVNILGACTAIACATLLLLAYVRVKNKLLLWSGLCFIGLAITNALLYLDLNVLTEINLYTWRLGIAAVSTTMLVVGLIWEGE